MNGVPTLLCEPAVHESGEDVPAAAEPASEDTASERDVGHEADAEALQMDPELAGMFVSEALDHLGSIEATVLELEAAPDDNKLLNDVFRPFHTIKGNAGALGLETLQGFAHTVENLLDRARSGRHRLGSAEIDAVLKAVDLTTAIITDLNARVGGQQGGRAFGMERAAVTRLIGQLLDHVDAPADEEEAAATVQTAPLAAATGAPRVVTSQPAQPVEPRPSSERQTDRGRPSGVGGQRRRGAEGVAQATVKIETTKLDNLVDMVGELVIAQSIIQEDPALAGMMSERLTRNLAQLNRITSDLQKNAMSMRMTPIRPTFQKMARLVRDLSRTSGKAIDLQLSGEETELDRRVVEDINDPLMHMVRNSIDHGVEVPEARRRTGKSECAKVCLSAYHEGGNIVISVADDGNGLDTEKILAKAIAQGLVPEGATPPAAEIHRMVFQAGFSTAEVVTEISGRGVGMDVVRRNIEALRGRIDIQSVPGQGTTFFIKLPLTLAIIEGLMLKVGRERVVMPTFAVRESLRPTREQLHSVQGES
ncbi:MAG: chemotaxis protein CheA, partial [Vicinamibacterales bacterium]|nr:chemotaxis protein CheA [Vicinamibacterales bacterium]